MNIKYLKPETKQAFKSKILHLVRSIIIELKAISKLDSLMDSEKSIIKTF